MASSPVVAIPFANGIIFQPAANVAAGSGGPHLRGWSLRSNDGTTVVVANLRKGTTASGDIIATINSATQTVWLGEEGVRADGGLYLEVVSGTVGAGAVYIS